MQVREKTISIPPLADRQKIIDHLKQSLAFNIKPGEVPIRFAITRMSAHKIECEIAYIFLEHETPPKRALDIDLFSFRRRAIENQKTFSAVMLVPTGIGAEIGGHAGDSGAVARLLAASCDNLVIHPNIVNASDINEMPENSLYVEGSIINRLLLGTVGLNPVRSNRVLVLIDSHPDEHFVEAAVNSVSAARATYGLNCPEVVRLTPPVRMFAEYSEAGCAVGRIENLHHALDVLLDAAGTYDAVALSSVIRVPKDFHRKYFDLQGDMVNPWGGVEAMLTHSLSYVLDVPAAHSPMFESRSIENMEAGVVDPRMAAEAVSLAFLQCILKGLSKAPRVVRDPALFSRQEVISVEDISCLIIPDGCLGIPTIAAMEQGIPVIAVRENRNLMQNDLSTLPWSPGQFFQVENYLEAVGVMNLIKAGLTLESVRRPISFTTVRMADDSGAISEGASPA